MLKFKVSIVAALFFFPDSQLFAGAWTLQRGDLRVKTYFLFQETTERYYSRNTPCPIEENCSRSGQRVNFPFNGESTVKAVYWEVNYGLLHRLQLNFQIPFFDISFTDIANPQRPSTSDIGDIRFGAKYRLLANPLVSTFKIEAKAPTGFFNKDTEVVPIGDGQWDLDFTGQFGKSLWPFPAYLNLDLGYRIRFAPDTQTSTRDPGNEFFFRGEAGYNVLDNLLIKTAVSGLYGNKFEQEGVVIVDSEREVLFIEPGIYWLIKNPLAIEASAQISLSGKNYPAGEVFNFGVSYRFSRLK